MKIPGTVYRFVCREHSIKGDPHESYQAAVREGVAHLISEHPFLPETYRIVAESAEKYSVDDDIYDDTIMAFHKFQGPRPWDDPNWTPPKLTLRQRIRIKRADLKRRVHQWVHDKCTEAICDY